MFLIAGVFLIFSNRRQRQRGERDILVGKISGFGLDCAKMLKVQSIFSAVKITARNILSLSQRREAARAAFTVQVYTSGVIQDKL